MIKQVQAQSKTPPGSYFKRKWIEQRQLAKKMNNFQLDSMVVVNQLALTESSRIEMFLAMVIWNAIYFKGKLRKTQKIYYLLTGQENRKPNEYEKQLVQLIKETELAISTLGFQVQLLFRPVYEVEMLEKIVLCADFIQVTSFPSANESTEQIMPYLLNGSILTTSGGTV